MGRGLAEGFGSPKTKDGNAAIVIQYLIYPKTCLLTYSILLRMVPPNTDVFLQRL